MPYTIVFELQKGQPPHRAQKESAIGALQMIRDIETTGMKVLSIKHSSGQEVLIDELRKLAGGAAVDVAGLGGPVTR